MTGVRLRHAETGETLEIEASGFFVAIGHEPEHEALRRPARPRRERLPDHEAGLDRDEHPRRVRGRRRPGSRLPAGRHGGRLGLHGRARRRALPRGARRPRGHGADGAAPRGRARPRAGVAGQPTRGLASARGRRRRSWIDLLDPTAEELREHLPVDDAPDALRAPARAARATATSRGRASRPTAATSSACSSSRSRCPSDDAVYYQEIDFVLTPDQLVTVTKTPPDEQPFDPSAAEGRLPAATSPSACTSSASSTTSPSATST